MTGHHPIWPLPGSTCPKLWPNDTHLQWGGGEHCSINSENGCGRGQGKSAKILRRDISALLWAFGPGDPGIILPPTHLIPNITGVDWPLLHGKLSTGPTCARPRSAQPLLCPPAPNSPPLRLGVTAEETRTEIKRFLSLIAMEEGGRQWTPAPLPQVGQAG